MNVNVARLRAELEFVTDHPERWDQGAWWDLPGDATVDAEPGVDWTCGTTACLAGWTVIHEGYRPHDGDWENQVRHPVTDAAVPVDETAARLLGLNADRADYLFADSNTLRDLWEFAARFTDGAIQVPPAVAAGELYNYFDAEDDDDDDDDDTEDD